MSKSRSVTFLALATASLAFAPGAIAQDAAAVGTAIFKPTDKLEDHWDGDPKFWRVEDGCITGEATPENQPEKNTFLIWKDGELDDFELNLDYKIVGGNSGMQVRSFRLPNSQWGVGGYQADFEAGTTYSGIVYGEAFRGILANRGQKTEIGDDGKPVVKEQFAKSEDLQKTIKQDDWNHYRVVFRGFTQQNYINGQLMSEVTDNDTKTRRRSGILALQLHAGVKQEKVQFKNLMLKRFPLVGVKKVVFAAGNPSHGPGQHEHRAGCMLLAKSLNEQFGDQVLATVYSGGWPKDPTALDNADALIGYSDGGGGHPMNNHLKEIDAEVKRGMGVGFIHYAVETVTGPPGDAFLAWTGGFFEANWSVNPHWDANFEKFPVHAVTRGVKPFKANDEWYYHMRFRPEMKGVTPILTALPGPDTLTRKDGPHEGNPAVREAVAKGEPQHMMWVSENEGGSRGFGFTGAHFHKNWQDDNFRKVVLNAITWISKAEVPAEGVPVKSLSPEEAAANLDPKGQRK